MISRTTPRSSSSSIPFRVGGAVSPSSPDVRGTVTTGLQYEAGADSSKGLYKAVRSVLGWHACVQRCQHKRQNVVSYLPKSEHDRIRRKMEAAYAQATYEEAKAALEALKPGLELRGPPCEASRKVWKRLWRCTVWG